MDSFIIKLDATHSAGGINLMEIRFDIRQPISAVKENLAKRFGTTPSTMTLQLKDNNNNVVASMVDDNAPLGSYGPQAGYYIHVIDSNPHTILSDLNDPSGVKKYTISEEEYKKRDDTFLKFKENMKKQGHPGFQKSEITDEYLQEEAEKIKVGDRCLVLIGERRGEVKYVGKVKELDVGYWVGVKFDEPTGDSNGSVKGKKYFDCGEKYGVFLRPNQLKTGDYPPEDLFNENDEI